MNDDGILAMAVVFLVGGLMNIFFAKQFVEMASFLVSVNEKPVRVAGWVALVVAFVLIAVDVATRLLLSS